MRKISQNIASWFAGAVLVAISASPAQAFYYEFSVDNPGGSAGAGDITNVTTTYNPGTESFNYSTTIDRYNGNLANGFWLVVSDGPNPKNNFNEYAILYADTLNNRVTSYAYNGVNSSNSWNTPGEFIAAYDNVLTVTDTNGGDTRTIDMVLDVSTINAYTPTTPGTNDWDGVEFANSIGVWFHPTVLTNVAYNGDKSLSAFSYSSQSWYDSQNQGTEAVEASAPGVAVLLALGLAGLFGSRARASFQGRRPLLA